MIHFFRKIRHDLIANSKPSFAEDRFYKYLKYALGEIVLVVLGILIALQINNWNEKKRKMIQFNDSMEQIYNSLKMDIGFYTQIKTGLANQIELIDIVLDTSGPMGKFDLPFALHYIIWDNIKLKTDNEYFIENLVYNPENRQQRLMAKRLAKYLIEVKSFESQIKMDLNPFLVEKGLPRFNLDEIKLQENIVHDSTYFSEDQMKIASDLVKDENFRSLLKTYKVQTGIDYAQLQNYITESKSIMESIKIVYPDVRIVFENIGIIGTSLNGWGAEDGALSSPMREVEIGVFETKIYLKKGEVKFRSNDSWIYNWGGNTFPDGEAIHDGKNIVVGSPGQYLIRLDMNLNKYHFILLD